MRLQANSTSSREENQPVNVVDRNPSKSRPSDIYIKIGEDTQSPLKRSSSFQSGRNFWVKFLEEKQTSPISIDDESPTSAATHTGREIRPTISTGSSLTGYSAFRGSGTIHIETPHPLTSRASLATTPHSQLSTPHSFASSSVSDIEAVSMQRVYRSKSKESQSSDDGKRVSNYFRQSFLDAKMSASFVSPKASEDSKFENQLKAAKSNLANSRVVTPATSSSPSPKLPTNTPKISVNSAHGESFKFAYGVWQRAGLMQGEAYKNESSQPMPKPKETSVQSIREAKDAKLETLQRRMKNFRVGVLKDTSNGQAIEQPKKELPQTNGATNPYKAWQRAGLMKNQNRTSPPVALKFNSVSLSNSSPKNMTEEEPDNVEFKNILRQWQSFSDDVPKSHLLSSHVSSTASTCPSEYSSSSLYTNEDRGESDNSGYKNRKFIERLDVTNRIQEYDGFDFFDQMRAKISPRDNQTLKSSLQKNKVLNTSLPPQRNQHVLATPKPGESENSSISLHVENLVESLKTPKNNPSETRSVKSTPRSNLSSRSNKSFKFEGGNRAIVLLERNGTYELLVGETHNYSSDKKLVLHNVELVSKEEEYVNSSTPEHHHCSCDCSQSLFSGNDDLINFFLPQMGMACVSQRNHCF